MSYAGLHMFMNKLNQLINSNDIPHINNRAIKRERPQFQLLYDELGSMIQTLIIDEHQDLHDLQKLNDLKQRFIYTSEQAQYIVDLFLSIVHKRYNANFFTSEDFNPSLNLDDARISLKFIKAEFKSMRIDDMKMESSPRPQITLNHSVSGQSSIPINSPGSNKLSDEITGIDRDAKLIRDKLVEDQKKLDGVSIVGMGGIGKTTLATKVFNDGFVKYHFHVRIWVTVSQTYDKRVVLTQILESICDQLDLENANDSRLRELVHKTLMGNRYLIVIDDIWSIHTWDNQKLFFPHDNNGSRILLTSRLTDVAKHANSDGLIHHLGYLNKERSLELLCQKVFQGNECPQWSIKPGMQIVENCKGLPLAVVVIAGVLAKHAWSKNFWKEIAERTSSYIVGDKNGCMETLNLSYNHLPLHLRECFLYLGGFPKDYEFKVQRLTWLWVAEGFIQQDGNRSLEDIAEGYLLDLIDRNLVIVAHRSKSNGAVIACKLHDLVRELCLRNAKEERFVLIIERQILSAQFSDIIRQPYKSVRMLINKDNNTVPAQNLRSILCFSDFRSLSDVIANDFRSFELLRVLDLQKCRLDGLPKDMELLVHLRYLAIWNSSESFPSSICNLWGLQTFIYITEYNRVHLPSNISDLVNLRHLWSFSVNYHQKMSFYLPSIEKPMNLQTISHVELGDGVDSFQKCFPYIKELTCLAYSDKQNDFKSLTYLEKLTLRWGKNHIAFPSTLKTLALERCGLPWSEMLIIQSLPNLQVLKLGYYAFLGNRWNMDEHVFQQLKFLKLEWLNIQLWEAYSTSFPSLKQLEIKWCIYFEEIPHEIGGIPTLELIKIRDCNKSVGDSVKRIEEEQRDLGNYDLKIDITRKQHDFNTGLEWKNG